MLGPFNKVYRSLCDKSISHMWYIRLWSDPLGRPQQFPNKILIGFTEAQLKSVDDWRRKQEDIPNRSESIRRLVEIALAEAKRDDG